MCCLAGGEFPLAAVMAVSSQVSLISAAFLPFKIALLPQLRACSETG